MKRLFTLFSLCVGMFVSAFAQTWTAPIVPGENLDDLKSSEIVYMYNVEADAFAMYGMTSNTEVCATRLTNGDMKATIPQQCYVFVGDGQIRIRNKENGGSYYFSCATDGANDVVMNKNTNPYFTYSVAVDGQNVYTLTNTQFGKMLDVSWTYGGHLTLADGAGKTKWAFIKESNVTNKEYALYKAKKRMYAIYEALVSAGKADAHKDALDEALAAYANSRATVESITEASRKLFGKVFVDIDSELNVSFLLDNADFISEMSAKGWGNASPATGWGEMEIYHSAFTFEQDATVPLGSYDLGFHSLYREDGSGSAPTLTVTTGKGKYTGKTPLMDDIDFKVKNSTSNNWTMGKTWYRPNGMQSCGQALAHGDAMAWAKNIAVSSTGAMNIKYAVTTGNQWANFQGFEFIFKGIDKSELRASLKSTVSEATALYGDGSGKGAADLKAVIDAANAVYADGDATNKAVNDAINSLVAAMANYRNTNASVDNPLDKTSLIVNPNFESGMEGWTVGEFWTQTNDIFKQKSGSMFLEKWTGRGGKVGDAYAMQDVVGMEVGVYQLKVAAQNIQEDTPNNSQSGAYIFANGAQLKVDLTNDYTLTFTNIENEVTIGYEAVGATGNWLSVDNFRLYYVGNDADFKAVLQDYIDNGKALVGTKMHTAAQETLVAAIAAAEKEIAEEGISGYADVATPLRKATEEAETSAEAYASLLVAIEKAETQYASNSNANLYDAICIAHGLYEDGETSYDDLEDMIAFLSVAASQPNTTYQVASSVVLNDAVDYHIAGITPFATAGSVDIVNPDAVVIIDRMKPSLVLESYMSHIYINGAAAKDGENCQVRMYNTGTIIFPYGKDFKPLTVYSEKNFGGTAVNDFGLENSNGYMNTLTDAKLNNAIRSFKLKRGYMVTFAIGKQGRGYSRCFIADQEDLEFATLPAVLDKHISSYRVFKWNNAQKKGLASDTGAEGNQILNSSWCYDWGCGQDRGADTECVPHKIHKNWPGVADCGRVTYSAHMKTDNEPGNSADDTPCSVADVLAYWEDAMATGLRLCSPSSHDGSLNWLRDFMNEIDARGWRCDILDMHCYWPSGSFPGLQNWYNDYKRPIWISEFVWGASWNSNGIFADSDHSFSLAAQQRNYNGMRPILESLNSMDCVERYAYWNSEADCSKIYKYGTGLSLLGEFYAEMNSGLGYKESLQFVPKVIYKSPSDLTVNFAASKKVATLKWQHPNGELSDSVVLERKIAGVDNNFVAVKTLYDVENSTLTVNDTLLGKSGAIYYRVKDYDSDRKTRMTNEVMVSIPSALGNDFVKYGTLAVLDLDPLTVEFNYPYEAEPAVFTGLYTNKNTDATPTSLVTNVEKGSFGYQLFPLQHQNDPVDYEKVETVPFMALPMGNHKFGDMDIEVGTASVAGDTVEVKFATPFPKGITPVVLAELNPTITTKPYFVRVWNATNEGFKAVAFHEEDAALQITTAQTLFYAAFTPGSECIDEEEGLILSAGLNQEKVYGIGAKNLYFVDRNYDEEGNAISNDTLLLEEPLVFTSFNTMNYTGGAVLRQTSTFNETVDGTTYVEYLKARRYVDESKSGIKNNSSTADTYGWVTISKGKVSSTIVGIDGVAAQDATGELDVTVVDRRIVVGGTTEFEVFTLGGTKLASDAVQEPGVYMVRSGNNVAKVVVK